jgi:hypothetical protein
MLWRASWWIVRQESRQPLRKLLSQDVNFLRHFNAFRAAAFQLGLVDLAGPSQLNVWS